MRHQRTTKQQAEKKNHFIKMEMETLHKHAQMQNQIQTENLTELKKTHNKHITTVRNMSRNLNSTVPPMRVNCY